MSWLYLPGQAVDSSGQDCSDGDLSATLKKTRTASKCSKRASKMDTSMTPPSGTTSEPSMGTPGLDSWMSSLRDSHANRSAEQESSLESETNATCGLTPFASFARYDQDSHCWRMYPVLFQIHTLGSSWVTCPRAGMMHDGIAFQLRPLARLTREIGFGLLPTPVVNDIRQRFNTSIGGAPRPNLAAMAKFNLWPTLTKTNSSYTSQASKMKYRSGQTLAEAVRMWPTPTVGDSKSARNSTANRKTIPPTGVHPGDTLVDAATKWPTPTAITGSGGASLCKWGGSGSRKKLESMISRQELNGALNPTWVEWLMGWPLGWTALEPLAMDKYQQWLEQHGHC